MITSPETTSDDIVVARRLVATSPTATWHLPSRLMWPLVRLETWRCHVVVAVVVVGDGCMWWRLLVRLASGRRGR